MKECDTCGNEIPDEAIFCPFCDCRQTTRRQNAPRQQVRTINLEAGMPSVDKAMARLDAELSAAKRSGVRLVRVIHGWGSSGTGGKLREACRSFLKQQKAAGRIRNLVTGVDYSKTASAGRDLIRRYPDLLSSERSDRHNPGITFVEP